MLSASTKFGQKLGQESAKLYKRVSTCHPVLKDHVTPKVEGIFTVFPLNLFCWACPWGLPCDLLCWGLPFVNCFVAMPFDCCVTIPWNIFVMCNFTIWILCIALFQFIFSLFGCTFSLIPGIGSFGIF